MRRSKRFMVASLAAVGAVTPAMGAMDVYLNFGPTFQASVNSVSASVGQPSVSLSQINAMQADIQQQLTTLFAGYQLNFSLSNLPGARQIDFSPTSPSSAYGATSAASFGNYDLSSSSDARIYTQNFARPLQDPSLNGNPAAYVAAYTRFLTNVAGHELGHSMGLQHWYSYAIPQIRPANYADTYSPYTGNTYQAYDVIADLRTGKHDAIELSSQTSIGLWDRAVLDITGGTAEGGLSVVNNPVMEVSGSAGHTVAAASTLSFSIGETSGLPLSLRRATLDSSGTDFYKFTTSGAGLFTAQVLSGSGAAYSLGQAFDPKITLLAADGVTPIWSNSQVTYTVENYNTPVPPNRTKVTIGDPFLNNIPLPSAGTYYLKVEAEGSFAAGNLYQMLSGFNAGYVAPDTHIYQNAGGGSWTSASAWQILPGGITNSPANNKTAIAIIGSGGIAPAVINNATVEFDQTYTLNLGIDELQIDSGNTLVQSQASSVMISNKVVLGMYGDGAYVQSGGSSTIPRFVAVGLSPSSTGTYTLSGNASLLTYGSEYIGFNGKGVFTQTDGLNQMYNTLVIAANPGSSGTYNLQGGTLELTTNFSDGIFVNPNGTFHQTGGTLIFPAFTQNGGTAIFDNGLNLSGVPYTLNGGIATIPSDQNLVLENVPGTRFKLNDAAATLRIGGLDTQSNPANFVWTAGTLEFTRAPLDFVSFPDPFGSNPLGSAPLTLTSTKHLIVSDLEWLADSGSSITQEPGSSNRNLSLYIGSPGTTAAYYLDGGTLTTTLLQYIGVVIPIGETIYGGPGIFQQTGGTNIAASLGVGVNAPATYTMSGGTLSATVTYNAGTIIQTGGVAMLGPLSGSGIVSVGGGATTATMTVKQFTQDQITIADHGTFHVLPNSGFKNSVSALIIQPGGQVDLSNNSLVIDYSGPVGTLIEDTRTMLQDGRLSSSMADATHTLGYADNSLLGLLSFAGDAVDATSVLIKYTYAGDANLDGMVDIRDLYALATHYNTADQTWSGGDFNYDGLTNAFDLTFIARNWQAGAGSPLGQNLGEALAVVGLGNLSVPEPAVSIVLLTAMGLRMRRRR